jgi:predicted lipoprotein with Yx(FWY)xxD motif
MAAALTLCIAASGCGQPAPKAAGAVMAGPLTVARPGTPYTYSDGAAARRHAEAECAARGLTLRPSIRDRFQGGAWVYVEGCA